MGCNYETTCIPHHFLTRSLKIIPQITYQWAYLFTSKPDIFYFLTLPEYHHCHSTRIHIPQSPVHFKYLLNSGLNKSNPDIYFRLQKFRDSQQYLNIQIFVKLEFHPRFMVWSSEYLIPVLWNVKSMKSTWLLPHVSAMWTNPKGSQYVQIRKANHSILNSFPPCWFWKCT